MANKKKRDWREANLRLGEISLKEILSELTDWVEDKAQKVPFKGGTETFCREWDFQLAGQQGHFEITAKISQIKERR